MSKPLEARLAKLEELLIARFRGKRVAIWFDVGTETEEQAITRARECGRLQGNDEPLLIRWFTLEEADALERKLHDIPGGIVPEEEVRPEHNEIDEEPSRLGAEPKPEPESPGLDFIRYRLELDYPDWGCV